MEFSMHFVAKCFYIKYDQMQVEEDHTHEFKGSTTWYITYIISYKWASRRQCQY